MHCDMRACIHGKSCEVLCVHRKPPESHHTVTPTDRHTHFRIDLSEIYWKNHLLRLFTIMRPQIRYSVNTARCLITQEKQHNYKNIII